MRVRNEHTDGTLRDNFTPFFKNSTNHHPLVQILLHLYTLRTPAEMDQDLDCPLTPQQVLLHLSSHLRTPLNVNATTTSNLQSQLTFGTLSRCEMRSHTHTKLLPVSQCVISVSRLPAQRAGKEEGSRTKVFSKSVDERCSRVEV